MKEAGMRVRSIHSQENYEDTVGQSQSDHPLLSVSLVPFIFHGSKNKVEETCVGRKMRNCLFLEH